ncbi:MAG: DUF6152 family protein [Gammaproteobacteria bacterium]
MRLPFSLTSVAAALVFGLTLLIAPVLAHHASAPFYDQENQVEVQGSVTRFVFRNPHAFLYLDVDGVEWQVELGAPVSLRRTGWTPETISVGTILQVRGNKSRAEGSTGLCCVRMTREDGSPVVSGGRVREERVD